MKTAINLRNAVLGCLFLFGALFPKTSSAQCPSVMGTGDPAVILLNLYGVPYAHFWSLEDFEGERGYGVTTGIQIGAILSESFQLVTGVEMASVKRSIPNAPLTSSVVEFYDYKTFIMEIPLDMRMRIYEGDHDEGFFIFGLGAVFSNLKETNDPNPILTRNEMLYQQFFVRTGFEHTIQVKKTFNVLWGLLLKVDPLTLAGEAYPTLNAPYYGGIKIGVQFGL